MSTGVASLSNLTDLSTLYPFAGIEYVLAAALLGYVLLFFVWQSAMEHRHIKKIMGTSERAEPVAPSTAMAPAE